jgi:outer membrane protein OmpA-like peptidoglycan-associated protein
LLDHPVKEILMTRSTSRSTVVPTAAPVLGALVACLCLAACSGNSPSSAPTAGSVPGVVEVTLPTGLADQPGGAPALPTTPQGDDVVDFGEPSTTPPSTTITTTTTASPATTADEPAPPIALDSDVAFAPQSSRLTGAGVAEIEALLVTVDIEAVTSIVVASHTDHRGSEAYNLELSTDRAEAVADVLVGLGVDRSLIVLDPRGEADAHPVGATESEMRSDRRVDITVRVG